MNLLLPVNIIRYFVGTSTLLCGLVALGALGGSLGQLLVTPPASDVERILLGAGDRRVGNVRILAVAVEAAFGFCICSFNVVARLTLEGFAVLLVGKCDRGFFGLRFVYDDDLGHIFVGCSQDGCHPYDQCQKS